MRRCHHALSSIIGCLLIFKMVKWASAFQYKLHLDSNGRYLFEWSVDYQKNNVNVQITAKVTQDIWFAVGFSDYGSVTSADLVVFWTDGHGNHHFVDGYTNDHGIILPDDQQDYFLTSVAADHGAVVLDFYRRFNTCDEQDYTLDNGTTHVIFFESVYANELPFGHVVSSLGHAVKRVQLLKPELPMPVLPNDTWTFEVRAPEILIPSVETTYWWHTTILPRIPTNHHIVKYSGVISEGNEDLVHHMEVFHCQVPKGQKIPYYSGPAENEDTPKGLEPCRRVIAAWAMGAQDMVYPEEAGVSIGGQDTSRFALLEVHYNNPERKSGRMDNSGIRFYVTSQLRKNEAGIMELGLEYINKMAIPPGQKKFKLSGYCVQDCTRVGLPPGGIYVFASQLHTHLTGRRLYTKHVRQGLELPELNRDNHFSPHFQEIRRLPQPHNVLPGDELVTTCEYDTRSRDKATIGGFSITDEMCVNYIHYYPRTELEVCKSSIQTNALQTFFFLLNRLEDAKVYPDAGDRANYVNINWTPVNAQLLDELYATSPLSMQCNRSDGVRFPGDWEHQKVSEIAQPLVARDMDTCPSS
uniref:DOMON domain-containing protein n=1 Tax=Biomphalaria glabrata TaxID=6526 RepID=A0A2C9LHW4_BIOGL